MCDMTDDATPPAHEPMDPEALKDAHGRTGRMFQAAGLPFEEDEFDDEDSSSSSDSDDTSSSSSNDEQPVVTTDVKPAVDDVTSLDEGALPVHVLDGDEGAGD